MEYNLTFAAPTAHIPAEKCSQHLFHFVSLQLASFTAMEHGITIQEQKPAAANMIMDELDDAQGQTEATLRPHYSVTRIIAGPGAGKTNVLTCQIARLHNTSENTTDNNYGIYEKMAMEMERRLNDLSMGYQHCQ
mmetsp:Transcript_32966/g.56027  ORF Transcript_32966/g.56027 Transcript_32966/m.56027 type:complete len:135 (+) Transcript_32966:58-462(+)